MCCVIIFCCLQAEAGQVIGIRLFKPGEQVRADACAAAVFANERLIQINDVAAVLIAPEEDYDAVANYLVAILKNDQAALFGMLR